MKGARSGDADKRTTWAEAGTGETYNQVGRAAPPMRRGHLMLRLERKFFVQELRTMRGDYFIYPFYGFTMRPRLMQRSACTLQPILG